MGMERQSILLEAPPPSQPHPRPHCLDPAQLAPLAPAGAGRPIRLGLGSALAKASTTPLSFTVLSTKGTVSEAAERKIKNRRKRKCTPFVSLL